MDAGTIVAAGEGARALAELKTWVDVVAVGLLIYGGIQWGTKSWKVGLPIVAGTAIIYALIASLSGVGAIGRWILGLFGITV